MSAKRSITIAALVLMCAALVACSSSTRGEKIRQAVAQGEFGRAAARLEEVMTQDRSSRDYMLDRMRLLYLRLADGRPARTDAVATTVFDLLRTQGINDDKTTAAAVFGEGGVIFWKGEPFEQAMAYAAVGINKGVLGEWDNARAAALSSLFLLKDFGENERGQRKSTQDIAREALESERRRERGDSTAKTYEQYLDKGYTPGQTDFALGYFLAGVANFAMFLEGGDPARDDEARDNFREAFELRPDLKPVADAIVERRANTIIVADFGQGPEKVAYGPDNALARFAPTSRAGARPLRVRQNTAEVGAFAVAADTDRMSRDHMWNNFEDVRSAKSTLGTALLAGGVITAAASDRNQTAQIVGASLAGLGLLLKATAGADTRHCEALPQRTYIAALRIDEPGTEVRLSIDDAGVMGLTLPSLAPPKQPGGLRLHYVRLPHAPGQRPWQWPGGIVYANDAVAARVPGDELPYILGGRCVRPPTLETLRRYQAAGNLLDYSLADLENLYRDEGIIFDSRGVVGRDALHLLEGGRALETPDPGSAGYARLFCQPHPPYQPRSPRLEQALEQLRTQRSRTGLAPVPSLRSLSQGTPR